MLPATPQNNTNNLDKLALAFTNWIGSVSSLITHTIIFTLSFSLVLFGIKLDTVLLVLTTILSLEAIYLAIFIQMSVNRQAQKIAIVEKGIDEISEDMEVMQEDVDEIAEDVEDIQEDIDEIQKDVEEIAEDVEEIAEDVEEIQENVEEIQEDVEGHLVDEIEKA